MIVPQIYITTTIPYVNARPHIGFALEVVQADVLARFRRRQGDRIRFQAGTDEVPRAGDADFTVERMIARADDELANGLGNLVNRVIAMIGKYRDGRVPGLEPIPPGGENLDAAARITRQCTPHAGRLPAASPAFRRLGSAR